jgi:hypothetical protein
MGVIDVPVPESMSAQARKARLPAHHHAIN